jgi:hypothetical protein
MRASGSLGALIGLSILFAAACSPPVDLTKGLQVNQVSTGWFDAGVVAGKNKLVPSISFSLKNVSDQTLHTLQVNAVFHRVNDPATEWGNGFLTAAESLAPGASTSPFTIRSQLGYTGTDARVEMLKNSQFVDAVVDLLAKYGSTQWARLGEYPISRQLIVR